MKSTTIGEAGARLQVRHHERPSRRARRCRRHHAEVGADVRREVGLVDDEEVALGDARPALARIFSPPATSMT
jgi:hypothetical protein